MTVGCLRRGPAALYLTPPLFQDVAVAEVVHGVDAKLAVKVNDLMLPVVKGVGSCTTPSSLKACKPCGSGLLQDHPIEQYIWDAKIDSCTKAPPPSRHKHFFFRNQTRAWRWRTSGQIQEFVDSGKGNGRLKTERALCWPRRSPTSRAWRRTIT